jgi:hypothetical protein
MSHVYAIMLCSRLHFVVDKTGQASQRQDWIRRSQRRILIGQKTSKKTAYSHTNINIKKDEDTAVPNPNVNLSLKRNPNPNPGPNPNPNLNLSPNPN